MSKPPPGPKAFGSPDITHVEGFTLKDKPYDPKAKRSLGDFMSDRIAAIVGSWRFIIIQSVILGLWIAANITAWVNHWDPYPFILLNLVLSFQAAFTAPIIMMAQNRQADIDRYRAELDYQVNLKAEMDIEALHQKIDTLRTEEIARLTALVEILAQSRNGEGRSPDQG
jgi:uncharacterized membrane protein